MTTGYVKRELVGGPKDGNRILVGVNLREVFCLGLGPATRLITRPDDGLGALTPMTRGRYVLAENGDLTWEGYS
jgi:hypothetical protein